ncbi:MAG: NADH-quinone oxidoreductase subunit J [Pirellulales bacterium]
MESINWHSFFFLLFALVACAFSVAVVVTSNVVRMAFFLIVALGATAGLFFLAGADFVGAMQLMIYVGGTLVLLVFGVMLTAQGPFVSMRTRAGEWIIAAIVGSSLLGLLISTAFGVDAWRAPASTKLPAAAATATPLGSGLLGVRVDRIERAAAEDADPTLAKNSQGMSAYLMPFEVVSVHLLVVLVAAAYLARPKKRIGVSEA